ncbi:MAG: protease modulator HflC [Lachnospiraceae bacterium]|nr:protease modulator HflC [Lachnospiraceae bacterium]
MKKKAAGVTIVILALIALYVLANSLYTVGQKQYAVVKYFGKIVAIESTPGLKFKAPFVESVQKISSAIQIYDIPSSDVITKDKKSMIADNYILWQVTDPTKFVQTLNASSSAATDRISVAVYNATKNTISSLTQEEVIEARGETLSSMIMEDANSDTASYGVVILQAQIKALDLPDDNKEAVYERMISERNNIAAAYTAEGEAEAKKIRNETDKQVAIMEATAEKEAAVLEAEGEASYMSILQSAYNTEEKAEFYNYTRSLDALKTSLSKGDKTLILDKDSELVQILYGR